MRCSRTQLLLATLTACTMTLATHAQRDWDDFQRAEYTSGDLATMTEILNLDDTQRELIEIFLDEYDDGYREIREQAQAELEFLREQMRLARDTDRIDRSALFDRMRAQLQQYQEHHVALGQRFTDSAKSILLEDQFERWPSFEQALRREDLLRDGDIAGEETNLFEIVERADLSEESRIAIAPTLEEYAGQLDIALLQREGRLGEDRDSTRRIIQSVFQGEIDRDDALGMAKQERVLRVRVRDVNIRYARAVQAEIPDPDEAAAFERAFKEDAFEDIYEDDFGRQTFEAAMQLPSIDETTLEVIESFFQAYELRRAQMNQRLETLMLLEEPREFERRMANILARIDGRDRRRDDDDDDVLDDAFDDREEMEADAIAQVHALLTEEQVRQLPRRDRGRGRGR